MDDEVTRRLVHTSTSAVPLSYVFLDAVTWGWLQAFLCLAVAVVVVLEAVRLHVGLEWWIYDRLTREYEQENPAGYALGAVGLTAVALVFPPEPALVAGLGPTPVAVPAMLMLTVADPFSGLLGSGELRPAKQAWVLLATFGVATLLALPFVGSVVAIAGGVAATAADGLKPVVRGYVIDDNLSIPVAAAVVMYAVALVG
jgi:dolichol kinase